MSRTLNTDFKALINIAFAQREAKIDKSSQIRGYRPAFVKFPKFYQICSDYRKHDNVNDYREA
jgi:hypothetical protein